MGELRLSCFGIGENALYTINAITPLLNPDISDSEARSVVDGLTYEQKDIAILALAKAFRETMARLKDSESQDALVRVLREVVDGLSGKVTASDAE